MKDIKWESFKVTFVFHDRQLLLGSVYWLHSVIIRYDGIGPIGHLKCLFGTSKYGYVECFLLVELLLRPQLLVSVLVVHVCWAFRSYFIISRLLLKL